eukprot:3876520-Rhodomonas_salina.2
MCGTGIAYRAVRCAVRTSRMLHDVRYWHSVSCGTGTAYRATRCAVLTERMLLPGPSGVRRPREAVGALRYLPTRRVLCSVLTECIAYNAPVLTAIFLRYVPTQARRNVRERGRCGRLGEVRVCLRARYGLSGTGIGSSTDRGRAGTSGEEGLDLLLELEHKAIDWEVLPTCRIPLHTAPKRVPLATVGARSHNQQSGITYQELSTGLLTPRCDPRDLQCCDLRRY